MSKSLLLFFILFLSVNNYLQAQVKIGSAGNPNSNAVLELDGGTSKGLLMPRLTATEITALTTAPDGLILYNKTDNFLYIRKSGAWQKIADATNIGGGGLTLPYSGTLSSFSGVTFKIEQTGPGGVDAINGSSHYGNGGTFTSVSGRGISASTEDAVGVFGSSLTGTGGYFTSNSGAALVTEKGNVGIGTISPYFPLDLNGRMRIRSNGAYNSAGVFFDKIYTPNTQSSFLGVVNDSTLGIYDMTNGGWRFFFDHRNNNVGINQSNPNAPLSFSNASGNKLDIYYGAANSRYGIGLQAALMQLYSASVNDDIAFGYGSSTSFTESVRIKGNGNVGIGNNNPDAKLLVNGSLKITDGTQGNGKILTSDANGKASWQSSNANTGFKALIATTDFPTNTFVFPPFRLFGNTIFDDGNNYRFNNEGYYTPSAGVYHFDVAFLPSITPVSIRNDAEFRVSLFVNGNENTSYSVPFFSGQSMPNINYSCNIKLNANDRVHIVLFQTSGVTIRINYSEFSFFSGYKVY